MLESYNLANVSAGRHEGKLDGWVSRIGGKGLGAITLDIRITKVKIRQVRRSQHRRVMLFLKSHATQVRQDVCSSEFRGFRR